LLVVEVHAGSKGRRKEGTKGRKELKEGRN
jgi:hypothetical protein